MLRVLLLREKSLNNGQVKGAVGEGDDFATREQTGRGGSGKGTGNVGLRQGSDVELNGSEYVKSVGKGDDAIR